MRIVFLVVFSVSVWASSAAAQREELVGVHARTRLTMAAQRPRTELRALTSLGGVFLGAIAGGYVGYNVLPHNCACDDPGLDELITGAFVGMAIGAAIGASAPDLGSVCSFDKRLMRSLAGAGLAAGAAYFLAGGSSNEGTLIAVPAAAIGGSLAALGKCWRAG